MDDLLQNMQLSPLYQSD